MTTNNTPMQITTTYGLTKRAVTVEVGHVYVVAPLDPRMTKDRNRPCQVLAIDPSVEPLCTTIATVRFLDTNRKGRVRLGDLRAPSQSFALNPRRQFALNT